MAKTITLLGEPKSTQSIYKARVLGRFASMYMTDEGKNIKQSYRIQTLNQWKQKTINTLLKLEIHLYFGTKRKCDIDNFNKLVLDSLTGIVYADDSQIWELKLEKHYDKENPRVTVTICD